VKDGVQELNPYLAQGEVNRLYLRWKNQEMAIKAHY
jgi:hypothetical protein